MKRFIKVFLFFILAVTSTAVLSPDGVAAQPDPSANDGAGIESDDTLRSAEKIDAQIDSPIDTQDIAAASGWVNNLGVADWMGPLAPVALSPFFGVTMLSGLAIWGPDWVTENAILGQGGPLANPTLFWVLLAMTLITSIPRLTKVSKPFVQAVDRIETYAVIIILLLVKMFSGGAVDGALDDATLSAPVAVIQFGVFSFTAETLLALAMVVNILVINSVKFFFEFLIWLTPVPFLDAVFEVCNKSVCAALMAIYAFSPIAATGINLVLLILAAIALRWISRRVRFYRTMILDPVLARMWSGFGKPKRPELVVFPTDDFGPFKAKSRLRFRSGIDTSPEESTDQNAAAGWTFSDETWYRRGETHALTATTKVVAAQGWLMHTIVVTDENGNEHKLKFSRRYDAATLESLLNQLAVESSGETESQQSHQIEFA